MHEPDFFDADLVAVGFNRGAGNFGWPGVDKVPARSIRIIAIHHDNGAIHTGILHLAFFYKLAPLPYLQVVGDAAL